MANAERCVCCGEIIPEGRMVCPNCEVGSKAKRLIDANALVWSIGIDDDGKQFFYVKAENIDNAPTVDAVEVVRGRWDEIEEEVWHLYKRWPITRFRCSQCKQMENKKSNYCPNCGADMRERSGK